MKNIRLLSLALLSMLTALPAISHTTFRLDDVEYTLCDEVNGAAFAMVTGNSLTSAAALVIPETVDFDGISYPVVKVAGWAFSEHGEFLTSIELPNTVTSIGYRAFYGCGSLESVGLPDGITHIGGFAFSGCSSLQSVDMPVSLKSISLGAFSNCSAITEIKIPQNVTTIGMNAFDGCASLERVDIPEAVTKICSNAFYNCPNITDVTYNTLTPFERDKRIFDADVYERAALHVAEGGAEQAMQTSPWTYFYDVQDISVQVKDVKDVKSEIDMSAPVEVYDMNGILVARTLDGLSSLSSGIYIIRQGLKTIKTSI